MLRMPTLILLAAVWVMAGPINAARAQSYQPSDDTFIRLAEIGDESKVYGDRPVLMVKSDKPAAGNDRLSVLRFDIGEPGSVASGVSLRLALERPIKTAVQIELYGVLDGAVEDNLDETTFVAGGRECAIDHSGNRLREQFLHDPDPETPKPEPLAETSLDLQAETLSFSGEAIDAFINARTDHDVAFVIRAAPPAEKGSSGNVLFHSKDADVGDELKPTLQLSAEPG